VTFTLTPVPSTITTEPIPPVPDTPVALTTASATTVAEPNCPVAPIPVTDTLTPTPSVTETEPIPPVEEIPVTPTPADADAETDPTCPVEVTPFGETFASATTETDVTEAFACNPFDGTSDAPEALTDPTELAPETPETVTGIAEPQALSDHAPRPHPVITAIGCYSLCDADNCVTCVCCWEYNFKITVCRCFITTKVQDYNCWISCCGIIVNYSTTSSYSR